MYLLDHEGLSGNTRAKNRVPPEEKEAMLGCFYAGLRLYFPGKRPALDPVMHHVTGRATPMGPISVRSGPTTVLRIVTTGNTDYVKARVDRLGSDGRPIRGGRLSRDGAPGR